MRLLLASSIDGYLASGADDDMRWTGKTDKAIFRLLTMSNANDVLLAGSTTFDQMPRLPNRSMVRITREPDAENLGLGKSLGQAQLDHPDAWLIGGPTLALAALRLGYVTRAFITVVPTELGGGMHAGELAAFLPNNGDTPVQISVGDVKVRVFTEDMKWPGR
ncbi:putative dihydrofolate reductase [Xanthomonas phage FMYAK-P1]|uniref:Dihydrofolate reductase n=1 Tax=Xanthomonas phage FMYAK-P1 TaxID=2886031 RepID=A0AAE9CAA9_9CAUD|nr:putative dihydrofolate reductase [Xanthomonas phage FMYAK-P1]UGL62769.1 putative dihydrofolate reductase [Xanthomonas phage FMYAK-P1]